MDQLRYGAFYAFFLYRTLLNCECGGLKILYPSCCKAQLENITFE